MEKNYVLYEHVNKINNKRYIGITCKKPEHRWNNGNGYKRSPHFYAAIEKYGWDNFEHNILYYNLTKEEAFVKEQELISFFDTTNPEFGYNIAKGGQTGPGSFVKMIEWQRSHKKFGEESVHSKKVRCIETGDVFGSIQEAERWCDSVKVGEVCRKNRKHAGRHPETNQLLSWEYAEEDAEVTIYCHELIKNQNKKNNGTKKKVLCLETNEIFNSETEACKAYNCARGTIARACNGTRKTALKKHWQWLEKKEK